MWRISHIIRQMTEGVQHVRKMPKVNDNLIKLLSMGVENKTDLQL